MKTLLKKAFITISLALCMGGLALLGARDLIAQRVFERRLDRISQRLGEPISFESITLGGLSRATVRGLQVGSDRWIYIQRIEVQLSTERLLSRLLEGSAPKVRRIALLQPTLIASGGDLKGSLKGQRARLSRLNARLRSTTRPKSVSGLSQDGDVSQQAQQLDRVFKRLRGLPSVELSGGRIRDTSGALFVHQLNLTLERGTVRGSWRGEAPRTGHCNLEGSAERARVYCSDDFRLPLDRFEVAGRQLEWRGGEQPYIKLEGLHLRDTSSQGDLGGDALPFSEVKLDLTAGLKANERAQLPLNATLVFPGGGRVSAAGFASRDEISMSTEIERFSMSSLASGQRGTLSASAQVSSKWREGHATFKGRIALNTATVSHPKLSSNAVGPFDLSAEGVFALTWDPRAPRRFRLEIEQAKSTLGHIQGRLNATWDQRGEAPKLKAKFEVPRVKAKYFAASIPSGLMPHLQPIELKGRLGFRGEIDLDLAKLKSTKLTFKSDLRRLKVVSINEAIDFRALSGSFDTKFVMPNGDKYTRVSGPETERWVELDEMPKLLPIAVTSQEDGGFYKHGGISLFHLRGSLVRNLKEGRFVRGGSTLTMQLIKNLYLHRKKTLSRKLEEVCLAWLIERALSKDQLITTYLNIVEFGDNVFGIKEAARLYFDKEPLDLTPEEISAITRLLPGPRIYSPYFRKKRLSRAHTNRVNRLLKLLQKRGHLKADEWSPITPTSLWEPKPEPQPTRNAEEDEEVADTSDEDGEIDESDEPDKETDRPASRRNERRRRGAKESRGSRRSGARELSDPF